MRVFAISDLHLPGGNDKPMDVFGSHWEGHFAQICNDWLGKVTAQDVVLIPGDISWAMQLKEAQQDLHDIGRLPGRKIILRGNHDYWWSSITQVRNSLPCGMYAVQNDSIMLDGQVFCGTRGWTCPNNEGLSPSDMKIYNRESMRLSMTLSDAKSKYPTIVPIVMMHYPPFNERQDPSAFTEILEQYGVQHVLYGHLHGISLKHAFKGEKRGVNYHQVSCDGLGFTLYELKL